MLIFLLGNLLVILNSYILTKFFSTKRNADFFLTFWLFFIAQIIFVELFLGIIGRLYFNNVLIILTLLLIFNYTFFKKYLYRTFAEKIEISWIFNSKILLLAISVFLVFFFVQLWRVFSNPPLGCDVLMYHLSFPTNWLKNGRFENPFLTFGTGNPPACTMSVHYFPFNGELLFLWLMFPFRNGLFANIAQAPFYFAAILAIYSILRKFSLQRSICLLTGLLWVIIPNCFKHMKEGAYIDIICAALFFMVLNQLLIYREDARIKNLSLLGIAGGIFVGLKILNIFWLICILPLFIYVVLSESKSNKFEIIKKMTLVIGLILLFSAYPFIRNFILTKNIFYPVRIDIFGRTIMPGYVSRMEFANLTYPLKDFSLIKLFFREGLGAQLFLFVLPATFLPLFISLFKQGKKDYKEIWLYFIPFSMVMLYLFYIKAYWTRFLYSYLGAALIVSAVFLKKFKWGERYIFVFGLICILSSVPELARKQQLLYSVILSLLLFLLLLNLGKIINTALSRFFYFYKYLVLLVLFILLFIFLEVFNEKYNREQYINYCKFYEDKEIAMGWKWLDENTGSGKRIAYAGDPAIFPLFGSKFKNSVFYVSVNDKPSLPHAYPDGDYRKGKNYSVWLRNLKEMKIDIIFVYKVRSISEFPSEDEWAREHEEIFRLIYNNPKIKIYSCNFQ
jgi:hypothetical protein